MLCAEHTRMMCSNQVRGATLLGVYEVAIEYAVHCSQAEGSLAQVMQLYEKHVELSTLLDGAKSGGLCERSRVFSRLHMQCAPCRQEEARKTS